jgi:predicted permease
MRVLSGIRLKLRSLISRKRVEDELDAELQFHLERLMEQNAASGMTQDDSRAKALRDLGNIGVWKEACRDQRGLALLESLWRDLRYALRMAARNRVFSSMIVLSLTLGVAGTSAIFSLAYALLVDPFPYRDSSGIALITFSAPGIHDSTLLFPAADYPRIERATTLRGSFAFKRVASTATRGPAESVAQVGFSPGAFDFLGVPVFRGRSFGFRDGAPPDAPARIAVLSYAFWQRRYGNSDVIGQTLELDREPFTIVGIAAPRFNWAEGDVFVPFRPRPGGGPEVNIAVRPHDAGNLAAVTAEMDAVTHRLAETSPALYPHGPFRIKAVRMTDQLLGNSRQTLLVLSAASALLLLIACANVSILLFARAAARRREISVRIALGAGTGGILRQLLVESVMLALAGGALGLLLASAALRALLLWMPSNAIPRELTFRINGQVILATFITCVLTGILFGLLPALEASRTAVNPTLQDGGPGLAGRLGSDRSRGLLIAAEAFMTILLMAGTAISVRALVALHQVRLGYDPSNVIGFAVPLPEGAYRTWEGRAAIFERLLSSLVSIPGVRFAAATGDAVPPHIGFPGTFQFEGDGPSSRRSLQIALVGGDYFAALKIPLLRGRLLTASEMRSARPLALINDEMARRYWSGGRNPVGARIHLPELRFSNNIVMTPPGQNQWFEVIGVVGTALNEGLRELPSPAVYLPYQVALTAHCDFLLRTKSDPHGIIRAIRQRVQEIAPDISGVDPLTLDERLSDFDRALPRFLAALFTLFGSVALALAATGLYSVVSYGVERRTREMGIRIALGANKTRVLALVTGSTLRFAAAGMGAGLLASIIAFRFVAAFFPDWAVTDQLPFVAVIAVFVPTCAVASLVPAQRAVRIAPVSALRHE